MKSRYIPMGEMLKNRYKIKEVIGEGGFGITYLGWDMILEAPVAVKEYFPVSYADRNVNGDEGLKLHIFDGSSAIAFQKGMERYKSEAKILTKFRNEPGIVVVYDFFEENNTAYIVMEYIKGISLAKHLKKEIQIPPRKVFSMMRDMMVSVSRLHDAGMVHRDISPENIMIDDRGKVWLIDFGATRNNNTEQQTITIMIKRGYAPEEQYRAKGEQGSFTDVYALCATMYHMLTGEMPPEATERILKDEIRPLESFGVEIEERQEKALFRGLAVRRQERFQTMGELYAAIYDEPFPGEGIYRDSGKPNRPEKHMEVHGNSEEMDGEEETQAFTRNTDSIAGEEKNIVYADVQERSERKVSFTAGQAVLVAAALICALLAFGAYRQWGMERQERGTQETEPLSVTAMHTEQPAIATATAAQAVATATPDTEIVVPKVAGMVKEKAVKYLKEEGFSVISVKKQYSGRYSRGVVIKQIPGEGKKTEKNKKIVLVVSRGKRPVQTAAPTEPPRTAAPTKPSRTAAPTKPPRTAAPTVTEDEPPLVPD